jgi:hypothetical protein
MLYAVQYRNMHTAIHHFAVFKDRKVAEAVAVAWEDGKAVPGLEDLCIEDFEIHWAYVPKLHPVTGEQIEVVNRPFDRLV